MPGPGGDKSPATKRYRLEPKASMFRFCSSRCSSCSRLPTLARESVAGESHAMPGRDRTLSFVESDDRPKIRACVLHLALSAGDLSKPVGRFPLTGIERVVIGRGDETRATRSNDDGATLRIEVSDGWMSSRHAEMTPDGGHWRVQDLGSKNGTFVSGAPAHDPRELLSGDVLEVGSSFFVVHIIELDLEELEDVLQHEVGVDVTLSLCVARILARARAIARSDVPVVIGGPTGTGKELLARYIHRHSKRPGTFVGVNCGAIAPGVLASTLFGHRKGAFSGASADSPGLFRSANGGTLLLDEVAELSSDAQTALLRVLQEREVVAVGDSRPTAVDVRVIAASHLPLEHDSSEAPFRSDLYMRLAGLRLVLPSLRERIEDLGLLLRSICLRRQRPLPTVSREALRIFFAHAWPGNVRELEQALVAALELARDGDGVIRPEHLPESMKQGPEVGDDQLRSQLQAALAQHHGNVSAVARDMGKARVQIRRWCKRFGLEIDDYRRH